MRLSNTRRDRVAILLVLSLSTLALVSALLVVAYRQTFANRTTTEQVQAANGRIMQINRAMTAVVDMETGLRGFIISGRDENLEPYASGRREYLALLDEQRFDPAEGAQEARWRRLDWSVAVWRAQIAES